MRSVIVSQIEDVDRIAEETPVYRLTNGLWWAALEESAEMAALKSGQATIYHDGTRFFLFIEGAEALLEVTLLACRRRVWGDAPRAETMTATR